MNYFVLILIMFYFGGALTSKLTVYRRQLYIAIASAIVCFAYFSFQRMI